MEKEILLEVKDLKKVFKTPKSKLFEKQSGVRAIHEVSFKIYKGETFGLVGESGCGKSTLGNIIGGLIPPSEGIITFENKSISTLDKKEAKSLSRNIQMIFQDPYSCLNPRKKIGWILEEPLRVHHIGTKKELRRTVYEMLHEVGFDKSYYNRYPHELSGGQRQRIGIVCSLMLHPKLIIADEPVSALDVSVQATILNLLKDLQEKYQLTYLFISHDLNVVEYMSDRIGVMYLGQLVELGRVEDLYNNPLHPYTRSLISAVPNVYDDKYKNKTSLKGEVPNAMHPPAGCPLCTRCPECMNQCKTIQPPLIEIEHEHYVRCHKYL